MEPVHEQANFKRMGEALSSPAPATRQLLQGAL